jgi:hypothetical protein
VDLYLSDLGDRLPAGLRLPVVHGVVDLGDERLLLVLEDVDVDHSPWDAARFARAARLLGRLNVRMTEAAVLPGNELRPSELLHAIATSRLGPVALLPLAADATWRHPLLTAERHLRDDLAELARRVPHLLDVVKALPQLQSHGDATPHNLLVPRDESDVFVVIDWAMASLAAVGDDLGQLLIGLAHDDLLPAEALSDSPAPTSAAWPKRGITSTKNPSASAWTPVWRCAARSPHCPSSASASPSPTSWLSGFANDSH